MRTAIGVGAAPKYWWRPNAVVPLVDDGYLFAMHLPQTTTWGAAPSYVPLGVVGAAAGSTDATVAAGANILIALPFMLGRDATMRALAMRIAGTAFAAGGLVRFGIYQGHSTNNSPNALLLDAGSHATDVANTTREAAVNLALVKNTLYWAASVWSVTGTGTARHISSDITWGGLFGDTDLVTVGEHPRNHIVKAFAFAALPDPFPATDPATDSRRQFTPALFAKFTA